MAISGGFDFRVGELAVYPAHGVGMIEGIEKRSMGGATSTFYVVRIIGSDAVIMVPTKSASSVGLRKVMKKSMVPKVYSILKDRKFPASPDAQTWNRRHREYSDKIKTGCAMEVARVLRDLYTLNLDKELSFGERRILDTARSLLVKELSVAKKIAEDKVEAEINRIMKR